MVMKLYSKLQHDTSYKVVQLDDTILAAVKNGEPLQFKSMDETQSEVVLCSSNATWRLKQKNHSNCVMVMKRDTSSNLEDESEFCSLNDTTYEYELTKVPGSLNYHLIPLYDGEELSFKTTFKELLANSQCSNEEAMCEWHDIGGCILESGNICKLSDKFITRALNITLVSIMADSLDMSHLDLDEVLKSVRKDSETVKDNPFTKPVIETILNKFGTQEKDHKWHIDKKRITYWYGLETLKKFAMGISKEQQYPLNQEEFLIKWKSQMPPYFPNSDLDIRELRGHYYLDRHTDEIHYIDKKSLPGDIKQRLVYLFKLQSQWNPDEMAPLMQDLNQKNTKFESFIIKYARIKRLSSKQKVVIQR
ncbi:Sister chromatid cohesion protein Dcc1 [Nakaseomyces glabratus]|nr:Ctf8p and Ctf18p associating protein [Nakaseomyces glabratus]